MSFFSKFWAWFACSNAATARSNARRVARADATGAPAWSTDWLTAARPLAAA